MKHRGAATRSSGRFGPGRFRRARRGVVSAIATLFGLLFVVVMISDFMLLPLPGQTAIAETQHVLQVEDQLAALQPTILAESRAVSPTTLTLPLTLGTGAIPPFGAPSTGTLQLQGSLASSQNSLVINKVVPLNISWSPTWPQCNNCKSNYYNISTNHTSGQVISARGQAGYSVILNLLGSNNTNVNIDLRGVATTAYIVVGGSNDSVELTDSGTPRSINASFLYFGQHDSLNLTGFTRYGNVSAVFMSDVIKNGVQNCPFGNQSVTDQLFLPTSVSGGLLHVNGTWWNANGNNTNSTTTYGTTPYWMIYQNFSESHGPQACAFAKSTSSSYPLANSGSLVVHLANQYAPVTDVAFEQGAVIAQQAGGLPVMVEPPLISYSSYNPQGLNGTITLLNFVGTPASVTGVGPTGITTRMLFKSQYTIGTGPGPFYFSGFSFSITTAYPAAWASFFGSQHVIFPSGAQCFTTGPSPTSTSCNKAVLLGQPPVTVKSVMFVQAIQVTVITVGVSFIAL